MGLFESPILKCSSIPFNRLDGGGIRSKPPSALKSVEAR